MQYVHSTMFERIVTVCSSLSVHAARQRNVRKRVALSDLTTAFLPLLCQFDYERRFEREALWVYDADREAVAWYETVDLNSTRAAYHDIWLWKEVTILKKIY